MASKTKKRKPLELEVSDFGPIAQAKIELRPLTVFVGPSNTGKSYLAILIYALHKFFRGYAMSVSRRTRRFAGTLEYDVAPSRHLALNESAVRQVQGWARAVRADNPKSNDVVHMPPEVANLVWERISPSGRLLAMTIGQAFGVETLDLKRQSASNNAQVIIRSHASHVTGTPFLEHRLSINATPSLTRQPEELGLRVDVDDIYESISQLSLFVNDESPAELVDLEMNAYVRKISDSLMMKIVEPFNNRAYYLPADRTGIMHAHQIVVSSLIRNATRAGFRDEGPIGKISGILADFMEQLIGISDVRIQEKSMDILAGKIENEMLYGAINTDQTVLNYPFFSYQPAGWQRNLPLMSTSSMVSELAPVVLYLRHVVRPGNTLIIEELEAHLHPGMQREFTRQIATMIRAGIRVIITTHSEWVLEELANLVYLSSLPPEQAKKIDESAPTLTPDQVGVWLFEPKKRPRGSVVREILLDKETGTFDSGFAEVSRALYNTWADIASLDQESGR